MISVQRVEARFPYACFYFYFHFPFVGEKQCLLFLKGKEIKKNIRDAPIATAIAVNAANIIIIIMNFNW
jgi:hypothetical protein